MANATAALLAVAVFVLGQQVGSADEPASRRTGSEARATIERAQALVLQKDRLRAVDLLLKALARETKGGAGHRELTKALDEIGDVFVTEQGQAAWSLAESSVDARPREALDSYQLALKLEPGNATVMKGLARAHVALGECDRADATVKLAESINPSSAEIRLLKMQAADCQGKHAVVAELLVAKDVDMEPLAGRMKSLQAKELLRRKEWRKSKALLAQWEQASPDDPEILYWRWRFSEATLQPDRSSAIRYVQACQNLSPRRRKAFRLDVDLCKGKDVVEAYLKSAGLQPSTLPDQPPAGGSAPQ